MKKNLFILGALSTLSLVSYSAPKALGIYPENTNFESVQFVPTYKKDVKEGTTSYTVKVVSPTKIDNDYIHFDNETIVKTNLYTYTTKYISDSKINKAQEVNNIYFNRKVTFKDSATITFRTNFDEKASDFINFGEIEAENNQIFIRISDNSKTPRFLKMPLMVVPKNAQHIKVDLLEDFNIKGVPYELRRKMVKNDFILYYLEPVYPTEEMAQRFAEYETKKKGNNQYVKMDKTDIKSILLREKISVTKDKNLIYSNNIVDLFIKK